ncbi:hypothetical protein ABEB36_011155 [Hypothenemus hampei]|uniref:Gustatory receptor n=1 Tax=Hypothenemus hampei TaxID=57062 RepID=A0ABD1EH72_HYPHA
MSIILRKSSQIILMFLILYPPHLIKRKIFQIYYSVYIIIGITMLILWYLHGICVGLLEVNLVTIVRKIVASCESVITLIITVLATNSLKEQHKIDSLLMFFRNVYQFDSRWIKSPGRRIKMKLIIITWVVVVVIKFVVTRVFQCSPIICVRRILHHRNVVFLFVICLLLYELKLKFMALNSRLKKIKKVEELITLQYFQKHLFMVMDNINTMYGLIIFFAVLGVISLILLNITTALSENYSATNGNKMPLLINGIYIELHVFIIIVLANNLSEEIHNTIDVCYNMAAKCDSSLEIRKKNLFLTMAERSHIRNVQLNAAGFFVIDNSAFIFIITTIGTYTTAILQTKAV